MSGGHELIKRDVLAVVARIPLGRVATHGAIGRYLGVASRHVAQIMAVLDDGERAAIAWHRVVADGGAVGRHANRDEQIARLKADGLLVAPVGIVQGLAQRAIADFDNPSLPIEPEPGAAVPRRARGMKERPTTST